MHMQVISKKALRDFWTTHNQAETPLKAWHSIVSKARWETPQDVGDMFGSVDFVNDNRAIFNIAGNKYRLIVRIVYGPYYRVMIKWVGTHKDYDNIDAETV